MAAAEMKTDEAETSLVSARAGIAARHKRLDDAQRERDERVAGAARPQEEIGAQERMTERDAALMTAEARASVAEASLVGARAELAAQRGRCAALEHEQREQTIALAQAEADAARLRSTADDLGAAMVAAEARADASEANLAAAQIEIARLRVEIDRAVQDIRERGAAEFALRGDLERLRRGLDRSPR